MNINVYLPDEIAARAKAEGLNLSRMLRDSVSDELDRRAAVSATLNEPQVYELDLEDADGESYVGRITGRIIGSNDHTDVTIYLTEDERVIMHDEQNLKHWVVADPEDELRDQLPEGQYYQAMLALGLTPVIDL